MNKIYIVNEKEYLVWFDSIRGVMFATPKHGDADIKIIRKSDTKDTRYVERAIRKTYL